MHCGGAAEGTQVPLQTCEMLNVTTQQYELMPTPQTTYMTAYKRVVRSAQMLHSRDLHCSHAPLHTCRRCKGSQRRCH